MTSGETAVRPVSAAGSARGGKRMARLWRHRSLLLMCAPAIVFFLIFAYLPMPDCTSRSFNSTMPTASFAARLSDGTIFAFSS